MENVIYCAIKFDDQVKHKLTELVIDRIGNHYDKWYCDHATLAYGDAVTHRHMRMIGKEVILRPEMLIFNDKASVILLKDHPISKKRLHITAGCCEGIHPVYSNQLIEDYEARKPDSKRWAFLINDPYQLVIKGVISYLDKNGEWRNSCL